MNHEPFIDLGGLPEPMNGGGGECLGSAIMVDCDCGKYAMSVNRDVVM